MDKKKYNQHGEGTLAQRIDGRFEYKITINGKRKSFYGKNEREVKRKVKEYQEKSIRGEAECKRIKISTYFEEWLLDTQKGKLKASSYDRIERTYRNHIKNTVGTYQLGNITTRDCQKLINEKAEVLSYSSTKKIYEALNACFRYAEMVEDMKRNPMRAVVIPSQKNFKKQTKEIYIPSVEEMNRLLDVAFSMYSSGKSVYKLPYANGIVILMNTGMRIGELLALRWDRIDFEKRSVKVESSVAEILNRDEKEPSKRSLMVSDTKTKNGKRTVFLNQKVMKVLDDLQDYYKAKNIDSPYVICDNKGGIVNYRDIKRSFDKMVSKANINSIGLHSLRHYFASVCISHNMKTFELSRMLGHGKISVTLDLYGHLMEEQENSMRDLLDVI